MLSSQARVLSLQRSAKLMLMLRCQLGLLGGLLQDAGFAYKTFVLLCDTHPAL